MDALGRLLAGAVWADDVRGASTLAAYGKRSCASELAAGGSTRAAAAAPAFAESACNRPSCSHGAVDACASPPSSSIP